MTDGLHAVREVATHWRRRYQAAQAIIEELQYDLTRTIEERDMALGDNDERDDYKRLYENKRDQFKAMLWEFWQMSNKRDQARRWSAAWKAAAKQEWRDVESLAYNRDELLAAIDGYNTYLEIKDRRIAELEKERDEDNASLHNLIKSSEKLITGIRLRDDRIAELEATVANLDPRIARLERITPPAPIQGVEDMWWIGCESWFAWEDGDE